MSQRALASSPSALVAPVVPPASGVRAVGYRHGAYAAALPHVGVPRRLPASGGWLLERPIRDTGETDAVGCYPVLACTTWPGLADDLAVLDGRVVSVAAVTDPFGAYDAALLARAFRDVVRPFKRHFVVDLSRPVDAVASSHHRRNARRAAPAVAVERLDDPAAHADEWVALYDTLARRHRIRGAAAFPSAALVRQLRVPGLVAFRACAGGETVGMVLWYVDGDVAYYHLAAYSDGGYARRASFALFWEALGELRHRAAWASLGGAAGVEPQSDDGLARFKAGWATGTRTAWLCGRVCAPSRYAALAAAAPRTTFFPAYRAGAPA